MKAVTDNKYQNTKSIGQKSLPLHKIPERLRKPLDTQKWFSSIFAYEMKWQQLGWSDSNDFNLK